ncbi:hypothetical protein B0J18DRAFT_459531 [Chaetomium sp. MPI-SDFR-AT-0129]|nr:hypothetical protein B0J18DRAFT_459531 [Chaetomium sp. MPI-SDFR-AT-0129]
MPDPQQMAGSGLSCKGSWGSLDDLHPSDIRNYLSILDTLKSNSIYEEYKAPRIVMLGAPSSGKAAVLRELTHGLCDLRDGSGFDREGKHVTTRFVTKYVLSRSREESTTVSLCGSPPFWAQCGRHDKWPRPKRVDDIEQLDEAILSAKRLLQEDNSASHNPSDAETSASVHELCIDIAGPNLTPLTLVDFPSILENHQQEGLAPRNSPLVDTVDYMIKTYLTAPESTLLAVVSADEPLSPQAEFVLSQVRRYDDEGHRTIGVVAKPGGAPASASDNNEFLDLVCGNGKHENGKYQLNHPWHVLRTYAPGEKPVTSEELSSHFFQENPSWCKVPGDQKGVLSLRKRIRAVGQIYLDQQIVSQLYASIQRTHSLWMRILRIHQTRVGLLEQGSQESQREALLGVAKTFKQLVQDGISNGKNSSQSVDMEKASNPGHALWEALRLAREDFKKDLKERGHGFVVLDDQDRAVGHDAGGHHKEQEGEEDDNRGEVEDSAKPRFSILSAPRSDLPERLTKAELAQSCLEELLVSFPSNPCSVLASVLMRRLTQRWESLASRYIEVVARNVQPFIQSTLWQSCIQENWSGQEKDHARKRVAHVSPTYKALMDRFVKPFLDARKDMVYKQLVTLVRQYEDGGPFMDGLGVLGLGTPGQGLGASMIGGLKVNNSKAWLDMFGGILDTVLSQYAILRDYFADAIIGQAELCLVCSLPGIMPEDEISSLPLEEVDRIAPLDERLQSLESQVQLLSQELLKFPQDLVRDHLPEGIHKADDENKRKRQDTQPKTKEQPPRDRPAKRVKILLPDPATSSGPSISSDSGTSTFDDSTSGQRGSSSFIRSQAPSPSDGPSPTEPSQTAGAATAPGTDEEPTMPATPRIPRLPTPTGTPPKPLLQHPKSLFSTRPTEGLSDTDTAAHRMIYGFGEGEYLPDDAEKPIHEQYPEWPPKFLNNRSLHPITKNITQFEYNIWRAIKKLEAKKPRAISIGGWGKTRYVIWKDGRTTRKQVMGAEWEAKMAARGAKLAWPKGRPGSDEKKLDPQTAADLDADTEVDTEEDTDEGTKEDTDEGTKEDTDEEGSEEEMEAYGDGRGKRGVEEVIEVSGGSVQPSKRKRL